jgi:hypothetical protein|tara:strand:- start:221 stop:415 length:195 start_codon:yes stop_codon:yes gene_type:complete
MRYTYDFVRSDDVEYSGQYMEQIQTQVRGEDLPLDSVCSGVESFFIAAGFTLNGSGVGLVPNEE